MDADGLSDLILERAEPPTHRSGIYFLVRMGEIIYVGKSVNIAARLASHHIDYEEVAWLPVAREHLGQVEEAYLRILEPPLNSGNRSWTGRLDQKVVEQYAAEAIRSIGDGGAPTSSIADPIEVEDGERRCALSGCTETFAPRQEAHKYCCPDHRRKAWELREIERISDTIHRSVSEAVRKTVEGRL